MDQVEQAIRIPVEPAKVPAGKGHVVDWSGHHLDSRPDHQPPLCRQPVGQGQVKTNPFHHKTMVTVKNRVAAGRHQRKKALQALQWQPIAADRGKPEGRAKGAVKPTAPRRDGQINQRDRQGAPVRLHQRHASIPIPTQPPRAQCGQNPLSGCATASKALEFSQAKRPVPDLSHACDRWVAMQRLARTNTSQDDTR